MRAADYEGIFEYSEELRSSMKRLVSDWVAKATSAAQAAHELESQGTCMPTLQPFRETLADVEDQIASGELSWPEGSSVFQDEAW
jgi:hypothetical protein